jgi:Matrixin
MGPETRMPGRRALAALATLAAALPMAGLAYNDSGHRWQTRSVPYYISPANNDMSTAEALAAIQRGADAWSLQSNADFRFYYMGKTSGNSFAYNKKNEVFFRNTSDGKLVAEAYRWYDAAGDIVDADIVFYDESNTFTPAAGGSCSGLMVLESFATHEFGHALGLSHSSDSTATMYPTTRACSDEWSSLAGDDLAGVEHLYPAASVNSAPVVQILSPTNGESEAEGATWTFTGKATDKEDGSLSASMVWTSNVDGKLGTGASLTKLLSAGNHVITAKATDSSGAISTQTVGVEVTSVVKTTSTSDVTLAVTGYLQRGLQKAKLTWSGAGGSKVEIFRNGTLVVRTSNDGIQIDKINATGSASYDYKLCEQRSKVCSPVVRITF